MMSADKVAAIQADLYPAVLTRNESVVHIVIGYNRSSPRCARHHNLISERRDAVLYQRLGRPTCEADRIAAAAGYRPYGLVNVDSLQLDAERIIDCKSLIEPQAAVDIFGPSIRRPLEANISVIAALYRQLLDPGVCGPCLHRSDLRSVA